MDERLLFTFGIPEYDRCEVVYLPNLDGKYLWMKVKEYYYQTYRKDGNTEAWNHDFYTAPGRYIDESGLAVDYTGNNKARFSLDPKSGIFDSDYYLIGKLTGVAWIRDTGIFFQFEAAEQISNQWSWAAGKRIFLWFSNFDAFYRISDDDTQDSKKSSLYQVSLDNLSHETVRKKVYVFKGETIVRKSTGIAKYDAVDQYYALGMSGRGMEIYCTYIPIHRFPDKDSELLVSADKRNMQAAYDRIFTDAKFRELIDAYFVSRRYQGNYRYSDLGGTIHYSLPGGNLLGGTFTGQIWDMGSKGRWLLVEISPLAYRWDKESNALIGFDYGFVNEHIAFPNGSDIHMEIIPRGSGKTDESDDAEEKDEINWLIPAGILAGALILR
jgi:hypothetical protein